MTLARRKRGSGQPPRPGSRPERRRRRRERPLHRRPTWPGCSCPCLVFSQACCWESPPLPLPPTQKKRRRRARITDPGGGGGDSGSDSLLRLKREKGRGGAGKGSGDAAGAPRSSMRLWEGITRHRQPWRRQGEERQRERESRGGQLGAATKSKTNLWSSSPTSLTSLPLPVDANAVGGH